jgi:hypothetical protein
MWYGVLLYRWLHLAVHKAVIRVIPLLPGVFWVLLVFCGAESYWLPTADSVRQTQLPGARRIRQG